MGPFGVLLGVLARHSRQEIEEGYIEKVLSALKEAIDGREGEEGASMSGHGERERSLWAHPRPRGYERWARRAASAITGREMEWTHEAEETLLEWLAPEWPAQIVAAEERDDYPEDPAERARHRVWALHRVVGFARETLQLVVEVEPASPDPDEREPGSLLEPTSAKVYALNQGSDDPEGGFVITELCILGADQGLLGEKEEPLSWTLAVTLRSRAHRLASP